MLFNFHIPKTAGTAIASLLQTSHGDRHIQLYYQPPFPFLGAVECKKLRYFYGDCLSLSSHNVRRFEAEDFWPDARFLVVLRDPVERYCSAFFHLRRVAPHVKFGRRCVTSLEDFVLNWPEEHNVMVRFLCGLVPGDEVFPWHLDAAIAELNRYDLVGLTEYMPETIRRLKLLAPSIIGCMPRVNYNLNREPNTTYRSSLSEANLDLVEKVNLLDSKLYKYALALFQR